MVEDGLVTVAFSFDEHVAQLASLAKRYADRQPDLADLCLVRMSELHPRHSVITVDRADFRIYRRNKRDTIPLVCPPVRQAVARRGSWRGRYLLAAALGRRFSSAHTSIVGGPPAP